jgi:hypothetical protein
MRDPPSASDDAVPSADAFTQLVTFLGTGSFTKLTASLESRLANADAADAARVIEEAGLVEDLLSAALLVRSQIGRLNDLIHATAISLALPALLEPGERLANRPSLASGNDPSRQFDLQTTHRVAEFKLALWSGTDAMRKRATFHDLVHLAAHQGPERAELYVVGPKPIRFLRTSRSSAAWAMNRGSETTRALFEERFGSPDMTIRDFVAGPAAHVRLIDITEILPGARTALNGGEVSLA